MKSTLAKYEARKQKPTFQSKKTSQTYSTIYKQIHSQLEHICDKNNKEQKNKAIKSEKPEKYSLGSIKKKSSIVNIPLNPSRDQSNMHPLGRQLMHKPSKNSHTLLVQQKSRQNSIPTSSVCSLDKKSFNYQYIIGKGGFGKVWRVKNIKNRNQYALKQMLKSLVMTKKSVQSVINERTLLSDLNSPFLVNMHFAFQDRDTLYLVLDLLEGGDLRHHLGNKSFSQIQAKFFIACIVLGLEYLHSHKIIHRDIKPENLVLDSRGYIRITDLGIARLFKPNNSADTSGTPGYMSPQVICRQNHGFVSDYFALGVIVYEFMTGKRPYQGKSRNQIRDQMLAKQVQVKNHQIPKDWSYEGADFINRLIQRKPENRLGFSGIHEIKNHPWIRDINWKKLLNKEIQSPFVPVMRKQHFDQDEQITIQDQQQAQLIEKNTLLLRKQQFQDLFKNYYFDGRKVKQNNPEIKTNKILNNNFFGQFQEKHSLKSSKQHIEKADPSSRNSSIGTHNLDMLETIPLNRQRRKPAQERGFLKF